MVVTNVSLMGSGGHLGEVEFRGLWSPAETRLHINLLELQVIRLAVKAFHQGEADSGPHRQNHHHLVLQKAGWGGILGSVPGGPAHLELSESSGHFSHSALPGGTFKR